MKLMPNKLTPMTALEVLRAFRAAFSGLQGRTPSNSTLAILTAQSALETGRWKSMHCYNMGNIRPPKGWTGSYCQFRCNEKINGQWVWFDPPSPGSNFLAFETAAEGAAYYMNKLAARWPEAWAAALAGDAAGFVHGLKQRGYFTADETPYRVGVKKLCAEFFAYMERGLVAPEEANIPAHEPPPEALQSVAGAILAAHPLDSGASSAGMKVSGWERQES